MQLAVQGLSDPSLLAVEISAGDVKFRRSILEARLVVCMSYWLIWSANCD
mgnify:CR=1 FL=1